MAPRSKCLIALIILTFLCTLPALGLFAFHTRIRCWITVNNETTTECPSSYQDMCSQAPASAFSSNTSQIKFFCPWRLRTAITGLASLTLTQILMIVTILAISRKWLQMPLGITALIALLGLLGALGLMIYDLVDSFQYNIKYHTSELFRPVTYLSNAILVILSTIFIVFTSCLAYRSSGNSSGRIASIPNRSQVSDSNHSLNITNTLGNTSKAPVLLNTSMSQVQLPNNASEILRDVPVYNLPSGNPNARPVQGNSMNRIYPSASATQNQSAANSSRALLPEKNNTPGRITPVNTSPQTTGRGNSGLNISGEMSTRRSEAYINRQVTPSKRPGQNVIGPGNNQGRNQMHIGQPQFSKSPGSRNNISPGRNAASIDQIVPIVRTPVKETNVGEQRRKIGI